MPLFLMRPTTENHDMPTRKNIGPTKYPREKTLDQLNTRKKKFETHEIPKKKNFGPTKYPQRHDGAMAIDP